MSTVALTKLWEYIQALSLSNSNKAWLAEKLLESSTRTEGVDDAARTQRFLDQVCGKWIDTEDADKMVKSIYSARVNRSEENLALFD